MNKKTETILNKLKKKYIYHKIKKAIHSELKKLKL